MRYVVRFTDIGRRGNSGQARLRRKNYRDGDEDDRASEREPLACAPALGERRHRSLARRLLTADRCDYDVRAANVLRPKTTTAKYPQLGVACVGYMREGACRAGVEWWARRLRTPLTSTLAAECGCGGRCSQ
jgi:hypothetical protein